MSRLVKLFCRTIFYWRTADYRDLCSLNVTQEVYSLHTPVCRYGLSYFEDLEVMPKLSIGKSCALSATP